jgi:hypothetical protein
MRKTCQTPGDPIGAAASQRELRVESNERRPARAGVRAVVSTAAREGLMREHEAGRLRSPWRWHSWFKRISQAATRVSMASLFGTGGDSSLAAPKNKSRDDRGGDQSDKDRDRGGDQEGKSEIDRKGDGRSDQETGESSNRDGDGRNSGRERRQERQDDESGDASTAAAQKQKSGKNKDDESGNPDGGDETSNPDENVNSGGGNDAGNAGSGFFDSPLATKARRRADDFGNGGGADEDDGIFVDVDPEGESIHETDSISFATGPQGIELLTDNITYFAEPPPPEPLPRLELPVREPGFPFGEDFPFGSAAVTVHATEPEPSDPGDTGTAPAGRAEPIPAAAEPAPASSDGGDNTMDFSS